MELPTDATLLLGGAGAVDVLGDANVMVADGHLSVHVGERRAAILTAADAP